MAAKKLCFVTVGATASFHELIDAVLAPDFLAALQKQNYSNLLIQYGTGNKARFENALQTKASTTIIIDGFELDKAGLNKYMREAKGNSTGSSQGVIISHAGSGTVLDALRLGVPLIVVPNASLLDNHQVELAEALAEQGYAVYGQLTQLSQTLMDAEALAQRHMEWPPVNSGKHKESRGLKGVLDEEMGFLD